MTLVQEAEQAVVEESKVIVKLNSNQLQEGLAYVQSAIRPFNVQEIFTYVHMTLSTQDGLTLTASNETFAKRINLSSDDIGLEIDEEEEIDVCIPGNTLLNMIKSARGKKVTLTAEPGRILFRSGGARATLPTMEGSQYPSVPFEGDGEWLSIPYADLSFLYKTTEATINTDQTRVVLTGVCHTFSGDELICVSTNSRAGGRAAIDISNVVNSQLEDSDYIIPKDTIREVQRLKISDENESINIRFGEQGVCYKKDNIQIYSTVFEGTYPESVETITKKTLSSEVSEGELLTRLSISKEDLIKTINISEQLSNNPVILFTYHAETSSLRLELSNASDGSKHDGIFKFDTYSKGDSQADGLVTFSIPGNQIKSILSHYAASDSIEFLHYSPVRPIGLKVSWDPEPNGHFIMPVRERESLVPNLNNFSPYVEEDEEQEEE